MTGFDDLFNSLQWNQNFQKSLGLGSQISDLLRTQERITRSFSGISMVNQIAKSLQHQKMLANPTLTAIEALTKSMSFQTKFAIPQTTIEAITSINHRHEQLFTNLRNFTETLTKNQNVFTQINSWQFAINGISGQLASIAANQQKWDLIDDFDKITDEAVSLNERIFNENGITKEGLNELKDFFKRIEIKVDKIDADANALFWKFLTLLSIFLAIASETRNWLPKPEYATKKEVETIIKNQFIIYEKKLKDDKEFRTTNRECKIKSKPRLKSLTIEILPICFEVTILQVNHKWIYVSYFSPNDNLPQTGWIMKKHLDKP